MFRRPRPAHRSRWSGTSELFRTPPVWRGFYFGILRFGVTEAGPRIGQENLPGCRQRWDWK